LQWWDQIQITADIYPQLADYGVTPNQATGTAYIFYANANCASHQLTKPIIFLDGYDPDNGRDVRRIYTKYINKSFTIPPNLSVKLADHLRSLGYDIIILDFGDGGDFMENNAMVVSKTIETLYAQHATTMQKDFVVIGPSMGALIGQFALSYMEHNNIPHHTRLFISFDGPHQGANVSIGAQAMAAYALQGNFLNSISGNALSEMKHNMYDNSAAKQMLLHHQAMHAASPQPHPFRSHFLGHLSNEGTYPVLARKIAIINGNSDGALNPHLVADQQMAQFTHTSVGLGWFPFVYRRLNWRVFTTDNSIFGSHSGIFFSYWPLASLLAGIPMGTTKISSFSYFNRSLDIAPGSYFGVKIVDEDNGFVKLYNKLPFNTIDLNGLTKFTFIPSSSSADLKNQINVEYATLSGLLLTNCANHTPFDAVYANSYATNHVDVYANIAGWFLTEIEKGQGGPTCPKICATSLLGASQLCDVGDADAYDLNHMIPQQDLPYYLLFGHQALESL
jgi:PGAP1-like protein